MLKILFQILIFTLFIFGNGYQSVVTTFMMEPMQTSTFKTIGELFDSKYEIIIDNQFNFTMRNDVKFKAALKQNRVFNRQKSGRELEGVFSSAIFTCRSAEIYWRYERTPGVHYYILPDRIPALTNYVQLDVGFLNPFLPKMQKLMDLCYEAGLTKIWRTFNNEIVNEFIRTKKGYKLNSFAEPRETLDFSQILPICVILLIGHSFGLLLLICEIFYHDFLKPVYFYREKIQKFMKINARKNRLKIRM